MNQPSQPRRNRGKNQENICSYDHNNTAHSELLGNGFPEYPNLIQNTLEKQISITPCSWWSTRHQTLLKNSTWGCIWSTSKLNLLLMNQLFIRGTLTHLLHVTELFLRTKVFWNVKVEMQSKKTPQNQTKNQWSVLKLIYKPLSICLFGPSFWNNAAREGSANRTCNFLSVLNSRQFQILLTLLIWFSPTENPSVTLFHQEIKCCLICNLFLAFQISNLGSPHQSVCCFLLRNKPSSQP